MAREWFSRAVKAFDKADLEDALFTFDDYLAAVDNAQNEVELFLPEDELDADLDVAGPIRENAWAMKKKAAREIVIIKTAERTDNKTSSNMKIA